MDEREIISRYLDAFADLFPKRRFAVGLANNPRGNRTALFQTNVESEAPPAFDLSLSRQSVASRGLDEREIEAQGVAIVEMEGPTFDVPLLDGGRVVGVLRVEYPENVKAPEDDLFVVLQLALTLEALLRTSRLLRESRHLRDYFSQLIDKANAPIVVIGRHRTIKMANRAMLDLTGLPREALVGEDFVSILPEDERSRMIPIMVNALRGNPVSNFEIRVPKRGGGYVPIAFNTASILSHDETIEGVIAIGRDLSEIRELEGQVIQAEKLATLGQLAAGVVHELNNPLTSISVYSQYLLEKFEEAKQDKADLEKMRRIHQNTDRILRFTRDLVTYARPSAGAPDHIRVHEVLDQAIVFCEHVTQEMGVRVKRIYTKGLPTVYAVRAQLHQVFINLITNACHAMPDGAGLLELETAPEADMIVVRVKDNGPGIPYELRERIFDPFFSTRPAGEGMGLGLAIVKSFIEEMKGRIEGSNQPQGGALFSITLPIERREKPR
ncbi:MAG: PAS domain S-box protein [Myxococcales bacterium]|nr:PAS domain S-box protein [Myxococcales bacterium]